jgi:hypothetical protein
LGDRDVQIRIGRAKEGQTKQRKGINLKLMNTSKAAMIVAGCLSLAAYVMAQGHGGGGGMGRGPTISGGSGGFGMGGPNSYGPTNNPGLTHMSDQGLQSSAFGRNTAQNAIDQNNPNASPTASVTSTKKGKRSHTQKGKSQTHTNRS